MLLLGEPVGGSPGLFLPPGGKCKCKKRERCWGCVKRLLFLGQQCPEKQLHLLLVSLPKTVSETVVSIWNRGRGRVSRGVTRAMGASSDRAAAAVGHHCADEPTHSLARPPSFVFVLLWNEVILGLGRYGWATGAVWGDVLGAWFCHPALGMLRAQLSFCPKCPFCVLGGGDPLAIGKLLKRWGETFFLFPSLLIYPLPPPPWHTEQSILARLQAWWGKGYDWAFN